VVDFGGAFAGTRCGRSWRSGRRRLRVPRVSLTTEADWKVYVTKDFGTTWVQTSPFSVVLPVERGSVCLRHRGQPDQQQPGLRGRQRADTGARDTGQVWTSTDARANPGHPPPQAYLLESRRGSCAIDPPHRRNLYLGHAMREFMNFPPPPHSNLDGAQYRLAERRRTYARSEPNYQHPHDRHLRSWPCISSTLDDSQVALGRLARRPAARMCGTVR